MASGFDRYFQIAPCFRDEDARGDRSPGEFYQLDMEMAFADSGGRICRAGGRAAPHLRQVRQVRPGLLPPPSGASPTLEAMEKYGSDKPDLRIDLTVQDATERAGRLRLRPL